MRIALYHGWELSGSGSNEYNRYLARALADDGHEVHVICREPEPAGIAFLTRAWQYRGDGGRSLLFERSRGASGSCTLHQLPHGPIRPVYVTDKQRPGDVRAFADMSDGERERYYDDDARLLEAILTASPVDILHANHVVGPSTVAARACAACGIPWIIYPHGSAIEYAVRRDLRCQEDAGAAIAQANGLIIGSEEVRSRLRGLYPQLREQLDERTEIVGVGVDTGLFTPIPRAERQRSIQRLLTAATGRCRGKAPELEHELRERLDRGDLAAVSDYRAAYAHEHPDQDLAEKLRHIRFREGKVLLFVGALTVGKGLQNLIAALPQLLASVPGAELVVVGSGSYREVLEALVHLLASGNGELLDQLVAEGNARDGNPLGGSWPAVSAYLADSAARELALAAGPALAGRVHFLGRLSHDLLRHLFPCADIAVFPSTVPEAYPLVLMESLANGVLPAASDFSGFTEGLEQLVPDLGRETVEGMKLPLAPHSCVRGIAGKLAGLLASGPDEASSARLRRIAVERYDWSIRSREMALAYGRMAQERPASEA